MYHAVRGENLYIIAAVKEFNVLNKKGRYHDLYYLEPECATSLRLYHKSVANHKLTDVMSGA